MARIDAFFAIDYTTIDFNLYSAQYDGEDFVDGGGASPDILHVYSTMDTALSLYGWDYTVNAGGFVDGGTVASLAEWFWDATAAGWSMAYAVNGFETPIQPFFDVAQTPSNGDDIALMRAALSGADKFYLSAFDDHMNGFDGNDRMYGRAGNDTLRGGDGRDKLYGGGDDDVLRGGKGADVIRGGAGRDLEIGGGGEDIFKFNTGDDKSIIKDFDARGTVHDVIDLSDLASVRNWSDLKTNHMVEDGADVRIDGGGGDIIVIRNVSLADLDKGDFLF